MQQQTTCVLEYQINKSDLRSHKLGLYPIIECFEPYPHLNWFEIKI
jgi:hypothetical protein